MLKFVTLASTTLLSALLCASAAQADLTKPLDMNGGHWEPGGQYQCHLDGCIPTASRYQYRSRAF
ncbi:MAG: hypothetical protein SV422_05770, partial [Pseudomonadota bacterium]|nr:hypothetical protein [Pseudomonadota bacterium]